MSRSTNPEPIISRVNRRCPEPYELEQIHQMLQLYNVALPPFEAWVTQDLMADISGIMYHICTYSIAPECGAYVTHYINTDRLPRVAGRNASIIVDNYKELARDIQTLTYLGYTEIFETPALNAIKNAFRERHMEDKFYQGGQMRCEHGTRAFRAFAHNNTFAQIVTSLIRHFREVLSSEQGITYSYAAVTVPQLDRNGNFLDPVVYMLAKIRS